MSSNTIDDGRLARDRPLADEDQPSPALLAASGLRTFEREPTRGGATNLLTHKTLAPARDLLTVTRRRQRSTEPEDAAAAKPLARDQVNTAESPDNPSPSHPQE